MGSPKALLLVQGRTFLARILAALGEGGAIPLLVAVRDPAGEVADEARREGAQVVVNLQPAPGPISSLQAGIRALPADVPGVFFCPVDHPLFLAETVKTLRQAFASTRAPIVGPVFNGRRGHPVIFHQSLFPELLEDPLPDGARSVTRRYLHSRMDVPVADPGILADIDTPSDYRRHFP
jgi:molybdenum cofactor cytidylyltransferase